MTTTVTSEALVETSAIRACRLLRDNQSSMTRLDLSHKYICDDGGCRMAQALKENTHLRILFVSNNHLGTRATHTLCHAIRLHPSLTFLDLSHNRVGDDGAESFAKLLQQDPSLQTLTVLRLNHNKIGTRGAMAISQSLLTNTTLTSLELMDNFIGVQGMQALAAMLPSNNSLHHLHLAGNPGGHHSYEAFLAAVHTHPTTLQEITVDGAQGDLQFHLDLSRFGRECIQNYDIPQALWGFIFAKVSNNLKLLHVLVCGRPEIFMTK